MASIPNTPAHKEVLHEPDDSRIDDQSDDDSDIHHEDSKPTGLQATKRGGAQEQEDRYTVEANTGYSLFSNPPDLARVRQQLFDLKVDMEMSDTDFEQYFPFVDNVWRKSKAIEPGKESGNAVEIYCCRLKAAGQTKSATPRPQVEGKQQRRKRKREEKTCSMAMKVTYLDEPSKRVRITRAVGPEEAHTHDLDYMDQNKRNSAIMDVARREAQRAFLPGSIFWKMQDEPAKMDEAGGKFMKVSDVRNVQYPWRQQNVKVELKAHEGYHQTRSGPRNRRASGSAPATPLNGEPKPLVPLDTKQLPQYQPVAPLQATPTPVGPVNSVPHPHPHPYSPAGLMPIKQAPPPPPQLPVGTLNYPDHAKDFLHGYLPNLQKTANQQRPHITLTWATSLDSRIALAPGLQTAISGPETKSMTHFLRSQHDAILIGVNTAITDNPGLNCRLAGAGGYGGPPLHMQPRPIIIDPTARLRIDPNMRLLRMVAEGRAKGPWIVVGPTAKLHQQAVQTLKAHGGEFLQINEIHPERGLEWEALFSIFYKEGIQSVMVEGGAKVLSELLNPRYAHCIDSVIMTIAPTFFGKTAVEVSPATEYEGNQPVQSRLTNVRWQPMGQSDMILCAHMEPPRRQALLPGIQEFSQQPQQAAGPPPQLPPVNGQYSHTNGTAPGPPSTIPGPAPNATPARSLPPPHAHGPPPANTPSGHDRSPTTGRR